MYCLSMMYVCVRPCLQQEIEERPTRRLFPLTATCKIADVISFVKNTELGVPLWFTLPRCQYLSNVAPKGGLTVD
jgi:hypothetical protein